MSGLLATGGTDSGVETENDSNDVSDHPLAPIASNNLDSHEFGTRKDSLDTPPPPAPPTSPEASCPSLDFLQSSTLFGLDSEPGQNKLRFPHQPSTSSSDIIINIEYPDDENTNDARSVEVTGMDEYDSEPIDSCSESPTNTTEENLEDDSDFKEGFIYCPGQSFPSSNTESPETDIQNGAFGLAAANAAASRNTCRSLIKFDFSELPKIVEGIVEPPPGLSFISLEQYKATGYTIFGTPVLDPNCRALVPYEGRDIHTKHRAFYSGSCSRKNLVARRASQKMNYANLKKERNEYRLRQAANAGNPQMLMNLLDIGTCPDSADELGRTALHLAACKGYSEIIRLLLQAGANPNKKDTLGNTALHLAACTNHFDVVTCLLRGGTDVSTLDNHGRNPLNLAQSKLKLLANSKSDSSDTLKVKLEIQQIIEMMLEYLQKKGQDEEAELLTAFASRLTLSTEEEDVKNLLENLSSLSLSSNSKTPTLRSSPPFCFSRKLPVAAELATLQTQINQKPVSPRPGPSSSSSWNLD